MSDMDPDLDRLQDLLNAIPVERDGMTIAELDGYVAALIVCPEMILPSEWLPGAWGGEHEFTDVTEAEATIAAVMGHYNRIDTGTGGASGGLCPGPGNRPERRRNVVGAVDRRLRTGDAAASGCVGGDRAERRRGSVGVDQHDRCPERILLRPVGVDA